MQALLRRYLAPLALAAGLASPTSAFAIVESFNSAVKGQVIAGQLPLGGTAPGTFFPNMTISGVNLGGGPHSVIVFDSALPSGNDPDLGTPNQTCPGGGPGVGTGGQVGMPGENCAFLGKLLIVPEHINDPDNDNIVNDPNDDAGGQFITFEFDFPVIVDRITILDIDNESATVELKDLGVLSASVNATDLGDNSAQSFSLAGFGEITTIEIEFSSSGAVAEIEYHEPVVAVQPISWSRTKARFSEIKIED